MCLNFGNPDKEIKKRVFPSDADKRVSRKHSFIYPILSDHSFRFLNRSPRLVPMFSLFGLFFHFLKSLHAQADFSVFDADDFHINLVAHIQDVRRQFYTFL